MATRCPIRSSQPKNARSGGVSPAAGSCSASSSRPIAAETRATASRALSSSEAIAIRSQANSAGRSIARAAKARTSAMAAC
jgi:hypothetical protein